jgi:hypothetical protein
MNHVEVLRSLQINLKLTAAEMDRLERLAARLEMTPQAFLRDLLRREELAVQGQPKKLRK